jgi:Ribbon-helix-helix protein, copG family
LLIETGEQLGRNPDGDERGGLVGSFCFSLGHGVAHLNKLVIRRITRYHKNYLSYFLGMLKPSMSRENQTLIAIRLDPQLLAAVDAKRRQNRQSRSELIREAIYDFVKELGVSRELIYPADRVGGSKGGRPKKDALKPVDEGKVKRRA